MDKRAGRKITGAAAIVLACTAIGGVAIASNAPSAAYNGIGDGTGEIRYHHKTDPPVTTDGTIEAGTPEATPPPLTFSTPVAVENGEIQIVEMPGTGSGSTAGR